MHETELKFQVRPGARDALEAELLRRGATRIELEAIYFDTPDGRLAQSGLALRLRREGAGWVQTLKAGADSPARRAEHGVACPTAADGSSTPAIDIGRHAGSVAYATLRGVLGADPVKTAWVEAFRTRVDRLHCDIDVGGSIIEAALDEGVVASGDQRWPICELELELKSGAPAALVALGRTWSAHAGLWLCTVSKAQRGARLRRHQRFGIPVRAAPAPLRRRMPTRAALQSIVAVCLTQVLANASDVAGGATGEEHIHQLRVGLRRLRTALREFGALDAALGDPRLDVPLAAAFRQLGVTRDDTAVARSIERLLEPAGAPRVTWSREQLPLDPADAVRDTAFQAVLLDLVGYTLGATDGGAADSPAPLRTHAAARLMRLHRRVARDAPVFERLTATQQHALRKRLKRLRYLAEFVAPLFGRRAVHRYLASLEPAQDALGRHIEIIVASEQFRAEAAHDARALWSVGWLQGHLVVTARACTKALQRIGKAKPFWTD